MGKGNAIERTERVKSCCGRRRSDELFDGRLIELFFILQLMFLPAFYRRLSASQTQSSRLTGA